MITCKKTRLKSGLNVVRIPMPALQSVTSLVLTNTGSRYEKAPEEGVAHFLEHMVFKGTENYPDPQILASTIDAIGADFNAFTSKEYTGYYVKSASKYVGVALDVISDMLLKPLLKQEDIDREKGVIIEEINMYVDTPMYYISMLFERMMFKGSGLSHDILGSKETVSSMTTANFENFLTEWYGPGNLTVVIAGDDTIVNNDKILEDIEKYFTKKTTVRPIDKVAIDQHLSAKPISDERMHIEHRKTEQAHMIFGWPGLSRKDKRKEVLAVLHTLFGSTMSSRLFSEVREKRGLCYYVRSDVDYYHDCGVFGASAGVDPKRVHEAISVIIDEFDQIASGKKPVTAEELQRAKDHLFGKITLSLEDSRGVAQYFGLESVLEGEIEDLEETLEKIKSVTIEQIQELVKELIKPEEMRFGLIGPYENPEEFKKYIK